MNGTPTPPTHQQAGLFDLGGADGLPAFPAVAGEARLAEQAAALGWSRGHAAAMAAAVAGELWQGGDGWFWARGPGGTVRAAAQGRVHALIGAGLLRRSRDGVHLAATEDGRRAWQAWCRHAPDPVPMTARQEAEPLPYLLHGREHRRRWDEYRRTMEEREERGLAALRAVAESVERAEQRERRNAAWRKANGVRNPFAVPPA